MTPVRRQSRARTRTPTGLPRLVRYAWALPNTLLGLGLGTIVLGVGGRVRVLRGVIEFDGGQRRRPRHERTWLLGFRAITFGHVVIAVDRYALASLRHHERVHVRQYEVWGPFFLPAYLASSAWQLLNGRRAYRDNAFEREAYRETG